MLEPDLSIDERVALLARAEAKEPPPSTKRERRTAEAFRVSLVPPFGKTVQFSGGIPQTCWPVTRTDGAYRVVYMPNAWYFALCVESDFGPLDIGVHGPALGCFASV